MLTVERLLNFFKKMRVMDCLCKLKNKKYEIYKETSRSRSNTVFLWK